MPRTASAINTMPIEELKLCDGFATRRTVPLRIRPSKMTMIATLNIQLPNMFPKARLGCPIVTAVPPVTTSGSEVIPARSKRPTHALPKFRMSLIRSASRVRRAPATEMIKPHSSNSTNIAQVGRRSPNNHSANIEPILASISAADQRPAAGHYSGRDRAEPIPIWGLDSTA